MLLRLSLLVLGVVLAAAGADLPAAPSETGAGASGRLHVDAARGPQTQTVQSTETIHAGRPDFGLIEPADPEPEGDAAVGTAPDPLAWAPRPGPVAGRRAPRPDRHAPPGAPRLRC